MANLLDYLDWRGDLTVEQSPFNEVDNLILAELSFVDFKGVVKALKENGYDGVLCVELDNPEICNFRSAQISRQYIKDVLKL